MRIPSQDIELAVAFMRSRASHRRFSASSVLSVIGISIGVAVMFLTLSVYDGYVRKMENIIFSIFPHVSVRSASQFLNDDDDESGIVIPDSLFGPSDDERCARICAGTRILSVPDEDNQTGSIQEQLTILGKDEAAAIARRAASQPGVASAAPLVLGEGRFELRTADGPPTTHALRILGVAADDDGRIKTPEIDRLVDDPSVLRQLAGSDDAVLVSERLLATLSKGEERSLKRLGYVRLVDNAAAESGELHILGGFRLGVHRVADNMLIAPLPLAQQMLGLGDALTMVGVELKDPYAAETVSEQLRSTFETDNLVVLGWLTVVGDLFASLQVYRGIIVVVFSMSLMITGFNTYNNMSITIAERGRHIGLVRALGADDASLYRIFLMISLLQGLAGTVLGVLLGVTGGYLTNAYLNQQLERFLPVQDASIALSPLSVITVLLFVCGVSAVAAILPARRAVRADILEPLTTE